MAELALAPRYDCDERWLLLALLLLPAPGGALVSGRLKPNPERGPVFPELGAEAGAGGAGGAARAG